MIFNFLFSFFRGVLGIIIYYYNIFIFSKLNYIMIYTKNKLITVNSKYGIQENGTMKSKMLFNYKNLLSDDENILKSFVTVINAQIPCSFYVINALNNKLVIAGPNTTTTVTRVVGTDPYPNLATGAEIPGTRTWSTTETSWAQFSTNSMRSGWACPTVYGPNGDFYWLVYGERASINVEPFKSSVHVKGDGPYKWI
jgi:hypothetical protein